MHNKKHAEKRGIFISYDSLILLIKQLLWMRAARVAKQMKIIIELFKQLLYASPNFFIRMRKMCFLGDNN